MTEGSYYQINYDLLDDSTILKLYIETFGNPMEVTRQQMIDELQVRQEGLYVVSRGIEKDS